MWIRVPLTLKSMLFLYYPWLPVNHYFKLATGENVVGIPNQIFSSNRDVTHIHTQTHTKYNKVSDSIFWCLITDNFQAPPFFFPQPLMWQVDTCWAASCRAASLVVGQPPDCKKSLETVTETSAVYWIENLTCEAKGSWSNTPPNTADRRQDMAAIFASLEEEVTIYRGSWRRVAHQGNQWLGHTPYSPPA